MSGQNIPDGLAELGFPEGNEMGMHVDTSGRPDASAPATPIGAAPWQPSTAAGQHADVHGRSSTDGGTSAHVIPGRGWGIGLARPRLAEGVPPQQTVSPAMAAMHLQPQLRSCIRRQAAASPAGQLAPTRRRLDAAPRPVGRIHPMASDEAANAACDGHRW